MTPSTATTTGVASGATSPPPPLLRPTWRFMLAHPARCIALGFGSGLPRIAPGTVGTLWGWAAFLVLQRWLAPPAMGWLIAGSLAVGWWACSATARHMNRPDPGNIVWDEIVAFWLVLWMIAPAGWFGQLVAFCLFRYFDAAKPGPVGWADARFKPAATGPVNWWRAGFGILFDDLVAAFCTLLVIAGWRAW